MANEFLFGPRDRRGRDINGVALLDLTTGGKGRMAREKAREILETHKPEPLPKEIQKELDAIIKNAENMYGKE